MQANNCSFDIAISADGSFVVFSSGATNLVAGDNNGDWDAFLRDRQAATTTLVSVSSAGAQGNDFSAKPAINADGRFVAFHSYASNFLPFDTNAAPDVFVRDRGPVPDRQNDLLADFGSNGLQRRLNNAGAWAKIHNNSPLAIATGDLDGNFKDKAIGSQGSACWCATTMPAPS